MEKSIEFIEANIHQHLTANMIAEHIGYSLYHYCRIFLACHDISVMEYVRKRRLSLAALALSKGEKIIDVALLYGFETASGFSKAFRREYHCSPTQYLKNITIDKESICHHVRIEKKAAFQIAGYAIQTNIADISSTKDIAALWDQFHTAGWEEQLYQTLNPPKHGEIGIFIPNENKEASYVLGVIVNGFEDKTKDMVCIEVPAATYAIFTTPPVSNTEDFATAIKMTWKGIFENWFPSSDYQYDQSKLDFEYYDERCHFRADSVMEIYIPIKKK